MSAMSVLPNKIKKDKSDFIQVYDHGGVKCSVILCHISDDPNFRGTGLLLSDDYRPLYLLAELREEPCSYGSNLHKMKRVLYCQMG